MFVDRMDGWILGQITLRQIHQEKKKKLEKENFKLILNTVTELQGDGDCKMTTELNDQKEFTFGEVSV